ncbi:hypothetical protein BS17DRAFT_535133 [Gyrodon lividus]|nr:hypothetical protein BS17DRAFT_535133 [Gyrodon lividus]
MFLSNLTTDSWISAIVAHGKVGLMTLHPPAPATPMTTFQVRVCCQTHVGVATFLNLPRPMHNGRDQGRGRPCLHRAKCSAQAQDWVLYSATVGICRRVLLPLPRYLPCLRVKLGMLVEQFPVMVRATQHAALHPRQCLKLIFQLLNAVIVRVLASPNLVRTDPCK